MRFTDGLWKKASGSNFRGGVEVVEVLPSPMDQLELLVATRHIASRGDTLGGSTLTVNLSSPCEDIVKVKIEHFKGTREKGPNHVLFPDGTPEGSVAKMEKGEKNLTLRSGGLSVDVNTEAYSYALTFTDSTNSTPKFLCATESKGQAVIDLPYHVTLSQASERSNMASNPDNFFSGSTGVAYPQAKDGGMVRFMLNELSLSVGEMIYGLGERFGPFIKNGQNVSMWNQDGGTSSEQSYKNVPFYLSSKGYGIFIDHTEEVEVEVGREKSSKVGFSVRGEKLVYYVIGGGSLKAVLSNYTKLTGKPGLAPSWTFGLYLSTSFTTSYSQDTVSSFLQGMKDRGCPVRTFHFDCFWMKQFDWCSFDWDLEMFPDPKKYLAEIKEKYNIKVCAWINPYISQRASVFAEMAEKGYLVKRTNGDVWQWDEWQPGMALVDFTNPDACAYYKTLVTKLLDTGVDTVKTDFGERIPHTHITWHDGSDPYKMHNYYAQKYNEVVWEALIERFGKYEAAVFARSGIAGGQTMPVHWGGDCESTFEAMTETLRGGLSLSCSGYGSWSHDIGGFEGHPPEHIFTRWVAFGLMSSHSRLHGSNSYRVPWNYGENAVKATEKFTKTKLRLMPYLYGQAIKTHETGVPMMRAMIVEFENDPIAPFLDKQYMLGDSLLVAPVFHKDIATFYLPAGKWTCFFTGEVIEGPKYVTKTDYPLDMIPLFVRQNSVLVLGPEDVVVPDYDYAKVKLDVRGYKLEGDVVVDVPTGKGPEWAGKIKMSKEGKVTAEGFSLV